MELQDHRVIPVTNDFKEIYIILRLNYEFAFFERLHQSSACTGTFVMFV